MLHFYCLVQIIQILCVIRLGSPLTMDQFGWTKKEAMYYMGITMAAGGVIACGTFAIINPLCKWCVLLSILRNFNWASPADK